MSKQSDVVKLFRSLGADVIVFGDRRRSNTPGLADILILWHRLPTVLFWEHKNKGEPVSAAQERFAEMCLHGNVLCERGDLDDAKAWLVRRGLLVAGLGPVRRGGVWHGKARQGKGSSPKAAA